MREKGEGTCGHGGERHQGVHLSAAEATVAYVTTKPTIASKTPATIPTYQYKNTHNDRQEAQAVVRHTGRWRPALCARKRSQAKKDGKQRTSMPATNKDQVGIR
jgi:hypothetical protein